MKGYIIGAALGAMFGLLMAIGRPGGIQEPLDFADTVVYAIIGAGIYALRGKARRSP